MLNAETKSIVIFIVVCTILILLLTSFITLIIYRYQQRQNSYFQSLEEIKIAHGNDMLKFKLEIQEQTFANISREIHDNIGQKLTLAKLHLNTLNFQKSKDLPKRANEIVNIIGEAINDLSDISRSMSSEIILTNGFIKALEFEVSQLNKSGLYNIKLTVTGESLFLDATRELVLFRITQEALNNIVKHAAASKIWLHLHYKIATLKLEIIDNGIGFKNDDRNSNGLLNMNKRATLLQGSCDIESSLGCGTAIKIEIPLYAIDNSL